MANVRNVVNEPKKERLIREMEVGETGYTVPWAYGGGEINTNYLINPTSRGSTVTLMVTCVAPGMYDLDFTQ